MSPKIHIFGNTPSLAREQGQILFGLDTEHHELDRQSERAKALYEALGSDLDDQELTLGRLPDGGWALVGLEVEGHRFAVETRRELPECSAPPAPSSPGLGEKMIDVFCEGCGATVLAEADGYDHDDPHVVLSCEKCDPQLPHSPGIAGMARTAALQH